MIEVTEQLIREVYKTRPAEAKKYDYGHLLVIGGSKRYTGAPLLVALAAMRAGCDLATMAAPRRSADAVAAASPTVVTWPLEEDALSHASLPEIRKTMENKTAAVIGPGAGREEKTLSALRQILKECQVPAVIDADAIRAVGEKGADEIAGRPFVFTPHAFEFLALTGTDPRRASFDQRMGMVKNVAKTLACVVCLKGNRDIISDGKEVAVNDTGSPFMTKGGTGDVLAGIIGALLARGIDPFLAAQAGCWISGKAGHLASVRKGEGLLATDVIHEIPHVLVETLV